ncbi:phage tail tube protein [Paenibacillus sp. GCM10023248]|uniref:phage tail tube protein n=1 Tax=unclassified Paenibacillus TaxID=185978 RepID=UPI00237A04C9|nr:phage tail tube protein [Paenibacillus sp. MAHUQ-63]MDD9266052.1 phage tail tube protein [Paenibacillus sp. MAHUQ-63]
MVQRAMGTKLTIGANNIASITSITPPEMQSDSIDVTTLSSPGGYKESIPGFKDAGEVSVVGFFDPSDTLGQMALYNAFNNGTNDSYAIIFPPALGASWNFTGGVTGFKTTGVEVEGAIGFEATIKVSGAPSLVTTPSTGLSALGLSGAGGTLSPAFSNNNYSYTFSGVTATSTTITATAASHALKLYIDGVYSQDLVSGSPSAVIPLTINIGKKLTILANENGKTQKVYEVVVVKTA